MLHYSFKIVKYAVAFVVGFLIGAKAVHDAYSTVDVTEIPVTEVEEQGQGSVSELNENEEENTNK